MKKAFILIAVFASITTCLMAQQVQSWEYPSSEELSKLKNYQEKVKACNIPENILKQMNTEELIDICVKYPFLINIFSFNLRIDGINNIKENFNGFSELLTRENAGDLLFKRYKKLKPNEFNKVFYSVFDLVYIEIFISQPEILNTLSKNYKKEVLVHLLNYLVEKNKYPKIYGALSSEFIGLSMVRILQQEDALVNIPANISYEELVFFSETGLLLNTKLLSALVLLAENYIK